MISSESLTEEFHRALDTMKLSGIDGNGETRHFIPRNTLENYLDPGRVQSLLQSYRLPTSMAGEIRNKYLRTFAALLFLNRPLYITEFLRRAINDDNLPISEHWPYSSDEGESFRLALRDMYENQWAFCPIEFGPKIMHKKNIEKSQILPILESKELTTGGFTRCWKVRIHSWFGTSPRENPQQTVFAVKEFTRANERDFDAEVEALAALSHRPSPHIVQYLGSYVHGNKLNLILEYADHGSLNEYLQSSKPPCSAMNLQAFWNSAMGLLRGLNFLHHASLFDVETGSMVGVHNDIKPENILVFGNNKQELYDLTFKIGGIKMSSRRTPEGNHPSLCGTEAYRAPEYDPGTHDRGKQQLYDIWSLGCILLEMIVWAMLGSDGLKRFWGARANELSPQEDGEPSFHNGTAPLNEVLLMYEHIRSLLAPHDIWTRIVLDLVENHMLVRSKSGRLFAGDIHRMWIDRSQKAFDSTADIDSIEILPLKTISRASTTFDGREIHTTKNSVSNASVDGLHSTIPSNLVGRAHHCITCNSRTMSSFRTEHWERHRDKRLHRFRNGTDIHSGRDFPSYQIPREVESLEHT